VQVPNVWLRPPNQKREADAAKALLSVPDGDHLTMLNVYNNYIQSMSPPLFQLFYLIV
jgi:pre-mRNA-splicing factor ATP-dependent RNA helicase DHX15/PRP43